MINQTLVPIVDDGGEGFAPQGSVPLRHWYKSFEDARKSGAYDAVRENYMVRSSQGITGTERTFRERTRFVNRRTQEVMTTSDFTHLADVIDRGVLSGYNNDAVPTIYETIGYRRDTTDLARAGGKGQGKLYELSGVHSVPQVAEKGEYIPIDPTQRYFAMQTYKYGCQWDVSWEAWLADGRDIRLLQDYPQSWGLSTRYTRQQLFTALYACNATLFADSHEGLAGSDNNLGLALTGPNLGAAATALRKFLDPSGNTMTYPGRLYLVVPPDLEWTARQILNSTTFVTGENSTQGASNPYAGMATLLVDQFLPALATTAPTTGWYLFADPMVRPAIRYGFLTGYEQPEIFVKAADAQRLVGGSSDPFDGNFASDDIEFKLRFTFGVNLMDWRGAIWSHP